MVVTKFLRDGEPFPLFPFFLGRTTDPKKQALQASPAEVTAAYWKRLRYKNPHRQCVIEVAA